MECLLLCDTKMTVDSLGNSFPNFISPKGRGTNSQGSQRIALDTASGNPLLADRGAIPSHGPLSGQSDPAGYELRHQVCTHTSKELSLLKDVEDLASQLLQATLCANFLGC